MRSYQQVAEQIKRCIVSGKLRVGGQLPSERKLQAQFDVSRVVVREAMRALSAEGLIETQAGRGHFVSYHPERTISDTLALSLLLAPDSVSQLVEFLKILEGACVRLAATRCTQEDLIAVQSALSQMAKVPDDPGAYREVLHQLHLAIVQGSHNPFLVLLTQAVLTLFYAGSDELDPLLPDTSRLDPKTCVQQHQQILTALQNHDPADAGEAMSGYFVRLSQPLDS
jgi:GntR family transcriptional repressor for pyruvate dehydrogenase complex